MSDAAVVAVAILAWGLLSVVVAVCCALVIRNVHLATKVRRLERRAARAEDALGVWRDRAEKAEAFNRDLVGLPSLDEV